MKTFSETQKAKKARGGQTLQNQLVPEPKNKPPVNAKLDSGNEKDDDVAAARERLKQRFTNKKSKPTNKPEVNSDEDEEVKD